MSEAGIARMRTGMTVPDEDREPLPDVTVKPGDKVLVQLSDGTVGLATVGGKGGLASSESIFLEGEDIVLDGGTFV